MTQEEFQKFSRVVEQTADSVLITDRKGVIEYVNPAFERMTGYPRQEAVGQTPRLLKSGSQSAPFYKHLWDTICAGKVFRGVLLNRKKNGDLFYWEQTITPLKNEEGTITHFVSTAKEITQRILAEKLREEFIHTLTHEIRTPLAVIREGISQAVEGFLPEAEERGVLRLSLRAADRLRRMVDDLLDLSKMELGKMPLLKEKVDLAAVVREVCAEFAGMARQRGLELKQSFQSGRIEVFGDPDKLTQVFTNLIGNALKFTCQGGVEVTLSDTGDAVECAVSDTGCGITEENLPRVFEKFRQFGAPMNGKGKGTGLGLAICKAIVELHGGVIRVEDRHPGAAFIFTLPKLPLT